VDEEKVDEEKVNEEKVDEEKVNEEKVDEEKVDEEKVDEEKVNEEKVNEEKVDEEKADPEKDAVDWENDALYKHILAHLNAQVPRPVSPRQKQRKLAKEERREMNMHEYETSTRKFTQKLESTFEYITYCISETGPPRDHDFWKRTLERLHLFFSKLV
jgi:cobalamin biosynthesis protein CobT